MNKLKKSSTYKKIFNIIFFQIFVFYGVAQNDENSNSSKYTLSIEVDKDEYSLYENIYIIYKIDFQEDSIHYPNFEDFTIISKMEHLSHNQQDSVVGQIKSKSYILKPNSIGEYILESPTFFINGEEIKGWKKITVSNVTQKNQEDNSEIKLRMFVEHDGLKPYGTYRYVVSDEFGYIEIFKVQKWEYYRKMTKKEFKIINKIK